MCRPVTVCLSLILVAAFAGAPTPAPAEELIRLESIPFRAAEIQLRAEIERGKIPKPPDTVEAYLSKPEGDGPFPAIVYLHGCGGLSKSRRDAIAGLMTGWGYVTLAVDSFATRGLKHSCDNLVSNREGDALAALRHLSAQRFVDPQRIAVVGSSQGAIVALQLASTRPNFFAVPDDLKFKAVVAYYPECSFATEQLSLPAIILIGERDDWTPAADCERWMARRAGKGAPVKLVVYPGAYHSFDNPDLGKEPLYVFGHWVKYDADATQRSVAEMRDFLAAQFAK
jgi:dienelactone hydrolase